MLSLETAEHLKAQLTEKLSRGPRLYKEQVSALEENTDPLITKSLGSSVN